MTVQIWWNRQLVDVPAWPTPVPGLVVNRDLAGHWAITHAPSGAAIAFAPGPEEALHAAILLGPVTDWTRSGTSLSADAEVMAARNAIMKEHQISFGIAEVVPRSLLAAAEAGDDRG